MLVTTGSIYALQGAGTIDKFMTPTLISLDYASGSATGSTTFYPNNSASFLAIWSSNNSLDGATKTLTTLAGAIVGVATASLSTSASLYLTSSVNVVDVNGPQYPTVILHTGRNTATQSFLVSFANNSATCNVHWTGVQRYGNTLVWGTGSFEQWATYGNATAPTTLELSTQHEALINEDKKGIAIVGRSRFDAAPNYYYYVYVYEVSGSEPNNIYTWRSQGFPADLFEGPLNSGTKTYQGFHTSRVSSSNHFVSVYGVQTGGGTTFGGVSASAFEATWGAQFVTTAKGTKTAVLPVGRVSYNYQIQPISTSSKFILFYDDNTLKNVVYAGLWNVATTTLSQSKSESVAIRVPDEQIPAAAFKSVRCVELNSFVSQSKLWYSYALAAAATPTSEGSRIWSKKILYNETDDVFDFSHEQSYISTPNAVPGYAERGGIVNLEPNAIAFAGVGENTDDPGWTFGITLNDPDFPPTEPPVIPGWNGFVIVGLQAIKGVNTLQTKPV